VTGVFVNYRTDDGEWPARMIFKELAARFGTDQVFYASESIPPGVDFAAEIERRVLGSDVVLAVIGSRWLAGVDGRRKIDDPDDWVRRELRLALDNGITVVPVLVDDTPRLTDVDLPADIDKLRRLQYLRVRYRHNSDVIELVNQLMYLLPTGPAEPWRVCLRDAEGRVRGAGVALGDQHVLTCAHVLPDGEVTAEFVGLRDGPSGRARVVRGWHVPRRTERRGDVALLELAEPRRTGAGAALRRMALSWDRSVRVCGFPAGLEGGVYTRALLAGDDSAGGEWLRMDTRPGEQRVRAGFGGAGVVDERTGEVLGIVVGEHTGAAGESWMIPVETILHHLPRVREWVTGDAGTDQAFHTRHAADVSGDQLKITSEWVSRRDSGDRLSIVRPEEATATVRLITESTPDGSAVRNIDLAIDVTNQTVDAVARRVLDRSGTPLHDTVAPVEQLAAGVPPMTIVGIGIDAAQDPKALLEQVFLTLLRQGCRLLLAIPDGSPNLPVVREWRIGTLADRLRGLGEQIEAIENIERDLVSLRQRVRYHGTVDYRASVLAVAFAVARDVAESDAEDLAFEMLDRAERKAASALRKAAKEWDELQEALADLTALRGELNAYQAKADDDGLTEVDEVVAAYRAAYERLWQTPVDLADAQEAVRHYRHVIRAQGARS
jgi:serine protease Do